MGLQILGPRIQELRDDDQHARDDGRNRERGKRQPIVPAIRQNNRQHERSHQRARLIQRLMQSKGPADAHLFAGVRQHHVAGWIANRLPHALQHDQHRGRLPVARKRKRRHRGHLHEVAEERHRPELPRPLADAPGEKPQPIAEQLAQPGHHADDRAGRAQGFEERPGDAAAALIDEVGKEADHSDHEHEAQRYLAGVTARRFIERRHFVPESLLVLEMRRTPHRAVDSPGISSMNIG